MSEMTAGLARAHHILAAYAEEVAGRKLRWWQLGRTKVKQLEALSEYSDRLYRAFDRSVIAALEAKEGKGQP